MDYKVFGICKDELSIAQYHMGNKAVLIISGLVLQEITDIFGPIAGYYFFEPGSLEKCICGDIFAR